MIDQPRQFRPLDTHPEIERVQVSLIRRASVAERLARMTSLSEYVMRLSRRAIAQAHPEWSEQEVNVAFIKLHHGEKLAHAFHEFLKQKDGTHRHP